MRSPPRLTARRQLCAAVVNDVGLPRAFQGPTGPPVAILAVSTATRAPGLSASEKLTVLISGVEKPTGCYISNFSILAFRFTINH